MPFTNLNIVYEEIQNCRCCPKMDKTKALRRMDAVDLSTDVFIISQALAESQLRISGVNFFTNEGLPGKTGKSLEKFLNMFERSIYPPTEVVLENGARIPARQPIYISVYNTEVAQCYPGNSAKGDRVPDRTEIENCLMKQFIPSEINIIKPKLLLLMGKRSRDTYYEYFLKESYPAKLSDHIKQIVENGHIPEFTLNRSKFAVLPIQHASTANPRFSEMLINERLFQLIKGVLK